MSNLIFQIHKLIHPIYYIVLYIQPPETSFHYTYFQKILFVCPVLDKLYSPWSCVQDNQRADDGDGQGGGS